MVRRRRGNVQPLTDRTVSDSYVIAETGKVVVRGQEVSIKGEGRMIFLSYVQHSNGKEWVDALSKVGGFRSFRPERITAGHTKWRCKPCGKLGKFIQGVTPQVCAVCGAVAKYPVANPPVVELEEEDYAEATQTSA